MEPPDPAGCRRFRCYRGLSRQTYMIRGLALLVAAAQAVVLVAAHGARTPAVVEPPPPGGAVAPEALAAGGMPYRWGATGAEAGADTAAPGRSGGPLPLRGPGSPRLA